MDNIIFLVQWEWGGDGVIVDDTPHNFKKFFNPPLSNNIFLLIQNLYQGINS